MRKTYRGSCHCKAVSFEADIDLSEGTTKCNCTFCWKQRMWRASPGPEHFRLLTGKETLGDHSWTGEAGEGHHRFCRKCGTVTHSHSSVEAMGGSFLTVQVSTLDNLTVDELLAAPVHYMDGRHDDWAYTPLEARLL